jgi:hypothetical protein
LVKTFPALQQQNHLFKQTPYLMSPWPRATNFVTAHHNRNIGKCVFHSSKQLVALAE